MIDEELIAELAEKEFKESEVLRRYSIMNCSDSVPYEQRKQNAINYALAIARQRKARQALDDAIAGRIAKEEKDAV